MRPVDRAADVAVFHRIDGAVVGVVTELFVVANAMLPEPPLPDAAFAAIDARPGEQLGLGKGAGEARLDHAPVRREVGVVLWQGPDRMEVFGQYDEGID